MQRSFWVEGLAIAGVTVAALAAYDHVSVGASEHDAIALDRSRRERVQGNLSNFELLDQDGRTVRFFEDLVAGEIVAITFMYTSCSTNCSLATQNVARARDLMAEYTDKPVRFVSITVDPERDGPQELKRFQAEQGLDASWRLLTGAPHVVTALRTKLGVYDPDPVVDVDAASHSGLVVLGNEPAGRWMTVPALVNPVRIRQAVERIMLPPEKWSKGSDVIEAVPLERVPEVAVTAGN